MVIQSGAFPTYLSRSFRDFFHFIILFYFRRRPLRFLFFPAIFFISSANKKEEIV